MTIMPMPREKWTDERLDDLNKKVDKGFDEMREGFSRVDGEIKDLRREMKEGFESLHRTLLAGALVIIAALIGLIGVSAF